MADFTNMNWEQIKAILDGFKDRINEFISNLETLMGIYGESTITREILDDALVVRKGETNIAKIRALHGYESREIRIKRERVIEIERLVRDELDILHREILGMDKIISYKPAAHTEMFSDLTTYSAIGMSMIPTPERECIIGTKSRMVLERDVAVLDLFGVSGELEFKPQRGILGGKTPSYKLAAHTEIGSLMNYSPMGVGPAPEREGISIYKYEAIEFL